MRVTVVALLAGSVTFAPISYAESELSPFFQIRFETVASSQVQVRTSSGKSARVNWVYLDPTSTDASAGMNLSSQEVGDRRILEIAFADQSDHDVAGSAPAQINIYRELDDLSLDSRYTPAIGMPAAGPEQAISSSVFEFPAQRSRQFMATRQEPFRMLANGFEFDAIAVSLTRDGTPWRTWYFGYNLGIVALTGDDPSAPFGFMPIALPTPQVDGVAVEYLNTEEFPTSPGGHYFYTADPAEQAALDSGLAGMFHRTGKFFNTGGHIRLCRFYGSLAPGPNSHFFTADNTECGALRAAQQVPPPPSTQQWNYEGFGFAVSAAQVSPSGMRSCRGGLLPIHRFYNNAYTQSGKNGWDSNHRFTSTALGEAAEMIALGWKYEGMAFCVPSL